MDKTDNSSPSNSIQVSHPVGHERTHSQSCDSLQTVDHSASCATVPRRSSRDMVDDLSYRRNRRSSNFPMHQKCVTINKVNSLL